MKQTWRWFGAHDEISIAEIRQTGATGIVSALHHIPPGQVWSVDEIKRRQREIEGSLEAPTGLTWDVVESLPVSEAIKTQSADMFAHIEAWRESLRNLAECGLETVCYNFMPVLDWTRTELRAVQPDGAQAMRFDLVDFAVFDLFLLQRDGATHDYAEPLKEAAARRYSEMTDADRTTLATNIVAGLPGAAEHWTIENVRDSLKTYDGIDADRLRANLVDFLSEVTPLAAELGMRLCCHPDDPPFALLGLPRIMSSEADYTAVMNAVDLVANGITYCPGSLGVAPDFDPVGFVERLGPRIHFAHLRNTRRQGEFFDGRVSFYESLHLEGDTDMVATVRALLNEEKRRVKEGRADAVIPMRPDHGQSVLWDLHRPMMPGYPLIGRMRALAELRGIMTALS